MIHTTFILFDSRNQPYQLLMQNFVFSGAHEAFFDLFDTMITPVLQAVAENPSTATLPLGFEQFLLTWLALAEKLANPDRVQDTPHSIPSKNNDAILANSSYVGFEPLEYIIRTHRRLYEPVKTLWTSTILTTNKATMDMLVDMGFTRAMAADALLQTGYDVTAAADWLLSNPSAATVSAGASAGGSA